MNEEKTQLLSCPFCGGRAHMARETDPDDIAWSFVRCRGCGVRTRGLWYSAGNDCPILYAEVRDEWNRRASPSVNHWTPVAERLPEIDGMPVAVFDPSNPVCKLWPATWDAQNRDFSAGGGWFERDEVTHWMPLPTSPSVNEEKTEAAGGVRVPSSADALKAAEELAEEAYGNGNSREWVEPRLAAIRAALGVQACEPCPRGADKPEPSCTNRRQCWEPCGELGNSEEHVRVGQQSTSGVGGKTNG